MKERKISTTGGNNKDSGFSELFVFQLKIIFALYNRYKLLKLETNAYITYSKTLNALYFQIK